MWSPALGRVSPVKSPAVDLIDQVRVGVFRSPLDLIHLGSNCSDRIIQAGNIIVLTIDRIFGTVIRDNWQYK